MAKRLDDRAVFRWEMCRESYSNSEMRTHQIRKFLAPEGVSKHDVECLFAFRASPDKDICLLILLTTKHLLPSFTRVIAFQKK